MLWLFRLISRSFLFRLILCCLGYFAAIWAASTDFAAVWAISLLRGLSRLISLLSGLFRFYLGYFAAVWAALADFGALVTSGGDKQGRRAAEC